jgi:hypothetical protein
MNELSCLHGSERYGACDDAAYQGEQNAGVRVPGRNAIRVERQLKITTPCGERDCLAANPLYHGANKIGRYPQ